MEYTSGASSWRTAGRRFARALTPRPARWRPGWSTGVPLIALAAGLIFTTSATTAEGTSLREDRRPEKAQLINELRLQLARSEARATELRSAVLAQTSEIAQTDLPIRQEQARARRFEADAAFTPVHGPGVTVRLNDAPHSSSAELPKDVNPNDLVVHQQDVEAVVNALWAGGAEAMSIMGVRVISTTGVLCAGSMLLLHGRVHSPPFAITAIGDPGALSRSLDNSDQIDRYRAAVDAYGLGYDVTTHGDIRLPGFDQAAGLQEATVAGQ
ncbi:DUF881 domain-containing protein [Pilimelia columellifera]|uniref:DUF881 domain-containing protein n=1 Tax=Pilimelia columellifera subsp. columellifera TaxID=706583 RepID=A0ABP6A8M0_9ACTN